jgi:predicted branched-subunit amino acid permease
MAQHSSVRSGVRAALPLGPPTFLLGASFGVLARPVMGWLAPIVMSFVVFSGAAQFAALSVLAAGGAAVTAIVAGVLMNARWIPMGFAIGPSLPGRAPARAAQAQAIVDASFVMASRGDGTFDRGKLLGATAVQTVSWWTGTVVGVLVGPSLPDPKDLGLDAIFPAFYLTLLVAAADGRRALLAAAIGGAVTAALMPVAPVGLPNIAAGGGARVGLRRA